MDFTFWSDEFRLSERRFPFPHLSFSLFLTFLSLPFLFPSLFLSAPPFLYELVSSHIIDMSIGNHVDTWLAMCHTCICLCMLCDTWLSMCHSHSLSCVTHMTCHVSSDTPCLEKREIMTVLEFNKIRLGNYISQDEFNDKVHFVIQDLEKFQVFNLHCSGKFTVFSPFSLEKCLRGSKGKF